jgi:hypothetical protein
MRKYDINQYMTDEHTLFTWTYIMHDAVNASQGKTGKDRPTWNEVYPTYFGVGDDSGAIEESAATDSVCRQVCSETITPVESTTKFQRRKYKQK